MNNLQERKKDPKTAKVGFGKLPIFTKMAIDLSISPTWQRWGLTHKTKRYLLLNKIQQLSEIFVQVFFYNVSPLPTDYVLG